MMRFIGLLFALLSAMLAGTTAQGEPLLTRVDHFYLFADDSERLFQLFRDDLQLPVVWPFKSYGDFASGGLSLGNVVMEFVTEKRDEAASTQPRFKGIAFEPAADADRAVAELERRHIPHGKPELFKYTVAGQERVGWATVELRLPPVKADLFDLFICDYKDEKTVAEGRNKGSRQLAERGGGPLGITSLKEIVVAVKSVDEAAREWVKLLDLPERGTASVFVFGNGPRIRFVQAELEGIQSVRAGIKSRARATEFLKERGMLGNTDTGRLQIAPDRVGGLRIELSED